MQGWRKDMEDAHIITDLPSLRDHTFVSVFDGTRWRLKWCHALEMLLCGYAVC